MPAGNFTLYNNARLKIMDGTIDLLADTLTVALVTNAYTPDVAAHTAWADVSANEITDADYVTQTLGTKALALSGNVARLDAANVNFGNPVTMAAKYAVIYDSTAVGDLLVGYVDLETTNAAGVSCTSSEFVIQWNGSGLFGWAA